MKGAMITLITVVALAVIGSILWATGVFSGGSAGAVGFGGNQDHFQAVFLSNGQVYFGQFSQHPGSATLSEIYYLQVQQPLQTSGNQQADQSQSELKLIKLGNELHGPEDVMRVNPDHILFVEDLKEDGRVVQAIRRYEQNGPDANSSSNTNSSDSSGANTDSSGNSDSTQSGQ